MKTLVTLLLLAIWCGSVGADNAQCIDAQRERANAVRAKNWPETLNTTDKVVPACDHTVNSQVADNLTYKLLAYANSGQ